MIIYRKAVLIIHGLAGGTYDQEACAHRLELNRHLDVYSFTLPGHDIKDKEVSTKEEWINACEKMIKFLLNKGYKSICVIGHSMGGVIATYMASKYKEIKKVVLVAPAFRCFASKEEGGIINAAKLTPDLIKAYSSQEFMTRISKLPINALKEFLELIEAHEYDYKKINIPVLFIQGTSDQIVPLTSTEKIYDEIELKNKYFIKVKDYYHDVFKGKKVDNICDNIEYFLMNNKLKSKEKIITI